MRVLTKSTLGLIFAISLVHCNAGADEGIQEGSLVSAALAVQNHAAEATSGAFQHGDNTIQYAAVEKAVAVQVDLTINGKSIELGVSPQHSVINGNDHELSASEKASLEELARYLIEYHESAAKIEQTQADIILIQSVTYLAAAPEGHVFINQADAGDASEALSASRNEGVTCIKKGTYVTAEYDDSRGNHWDSVRVGSKARANYGCMGRCGPDCGSWWAASSWTKDCMDHDQCSHKNYSSGGGSDPNCGDEYNEAQDDWFQGVWRGCRG